MANLKDIRNRIKSVKSIQQVTKAMKMVAAAKMRRAQENMEQARPYTSKLNEILNSLLIDIDRKLLNELQYNLLIKAADLIKNNGKIIYTVCSIFDIEGKKQIEEFLKKNKNFYIDQINSSEINNIKSLITKRGFIKTYPYSLPNIGGIDGFFIARIYKKL